MGKRLSQKAQRQINQNRKARLQRIRYGGIALIFIVATAWIVSWRNAAVAPDTELIIHTHLTGPANAPVQIVEYADLTCSACRQWHNLGFKEQLFAEFGDQINFEFRHFPVITPSSPTGAEAAQCASEQDGFWSFHDFIYENLEPYPNLSTTRVQEVAAAVGLDRAAFASCLESGRYQSFPHQAIQQAQADGVRGTPTFFINGQQVPTSYMAMSAVINNLLENEFQE
jgi:protein-disulfide isomerase